MKHTTNSLDVFLTGATGYIGGAIAEALTAAGHRVLGLARSDAAAAALRGRGIEPHRGDLRDPDSLRAGVRRADAVVHAGFVHDPGGDFAAAVVVEQTAVAALLDAARGTGKRFLYTSGTGVVGDTGRRPASEDDPVRPLPFVTWRPAVERAVLDPAAGVRGVVLRPSLVYGRNGSGVLKLLIDLARREGVARYIGTGDTAWSAVHVDDVAAAYALALERAPAGAVFHLAAGEPVTMRHMAEAVADLIGTNRPAEPWPVEAARAVIPFADGIATDVRVSAQRATAVLGWRPVGPSLEDDIRRGSYRAAQG